MREIKRERGESIYRSCLQVGQNDGVSPMMTPVFWTEDQLGESVNKWRRRWRKVGVL